MAVVIAVVVKRHAVELLEGICDFAHGRCKTRIERNALDT
jgi:hypothetical protein